MSESLTPEEERTCLKLARQALEKLLAGDGPRIPGGQDLLDDEPGSPPVPDEDAPGPRPGPESPDGLQLPLRFRNNEHVHVSIISLFL